MIKSLDPIESNRKKYRPDILEENLDKVFIPTTNE
jgi:hypothetical protein